MDSSFEIRASLCGKEGSVLTSERLKSVGQWISTNNNTKTLSQDDLSLVNFIHQSNIGEDVGTQSKEETKEVIDSYASSKVNTLIQEHLETLNTYKALLHIIKLSEETEHTGIITVQLIQEINEILMEGLHPRCGKIRISDVYTKTLDGEKYFYPSWKTIEDKFYCVIDQHNRHMFSIEGKEMETCDKLEYLIKAASWLLFNFLDVHPFSDGNGRTGRLLVAYVLMVLLPFPAHFCCSRRDYIDAIVSCRRHYNGIPSLIAALLVDGLYQQHSLKRYYITA
jgi:Fic family protein